MKGYKEASVDDFLPSKGVYKFGNTTLDILFVPGHSPGHIAFLNRKEDYCIGRTDLPGGNFDTLISSIQSELFTLDDKTVIYPGHGPSTTVLHEKNTNPFCAINN